MIEKTVAINILQDIQESLNDNKNAKIKGIRTIATYRKNLEIATNEKLSALIKKHTECAKRYGEYDKKTLKLNKKIDKEMQKIFNN